MHESNDNDFKNYSVPTKVVRKVREATREKTLEQIAHAQLMIAFNREQATKTTEKTEIGKYGMQADRIEQELKLNVAFIEWLDQK